MSQDNELMVSPGEIIEPEYGQMTVPIAQVEIDRQISTAKMYPRNVTTFLRETEELACLDPDTAASMFYSVPRAGKNIVGPSIRLAELVLSTWGNIRVEARIVEVTKKSISVEAACWDLQRNVAAKVPKTRKVIGKKNSSGGHDAPTDDMINIAINAAISVAVRDAIFRVVPKTYVNTLYKKAVMVALGKDKSTKDRRNDLLAYAKKYGITDEQLFIACEVKGIDDIGEEELIFLRGLFTAIKEGEMTIDYAFPDPKKESNAADEAKEALKKKKAATPAIEKEEAPEPEPVKTPKPVKQPEPKKPEPAKEPPKSEEPVNATVSEDADDVVEDAAGEPKGDDAPAWYGNWEEIISKINKESGWIKPFGDLAGLHTLTEEEEQSYSLKLFDKLMAKLKEVLKSKSQAALVLNAIAKSKLEDSLRDRLVEEATAIQAAL